MAYKTKAKQVIRTTVDRRKRKSGYSEPKEEDVRKGNKRRPRPAFSLGYNAMSS